MILKYLGLIFVLISSCIAQLELPGKCSVTDSECQRNFFQTVATKFAGSGIPQLGIPVIEPYPLKDVKLNFLMFDVTLLEGNSPGISTCKLLNYKTDLEKFTKTSEVICDRIIVQGNYTLKLSPLFKELIGRDICGDGHIRLTLEGWYFNIVYPFEFVRRDGKIYTNAKFNESYYISEVRKNAKITVDGIKIGGKDISKKVTEFFNGNWKTLLADYGKPFHKKSMDYFFISYEPFFNNVPATEYYTDDLSKYIKN